MSDVNIPLLRKAVEWAEVEAAKPEIDREWHQGMWSATPEDRAWDLTDYMPEEFAGPQHRRAIAASCGTTYCIAGYIAQSLDAKYAEQDYDDEDGVHVSTFAANAIGIDDNYLVPGHLFHPHNTIADVRRIAEDIAGERL